jgi:hypothetical protein
MLGAFRQVAVRTVQGARFKATTKSDIVKDAFFSKLKEYSKKHAKDLNARTAQTLADRLNISAAKKA